MKIYEKLCTNTFTKNLLFEKNRLVLLIFNIMIFIWSFGGEDVLFYPQYITSSEQIIFYVLTKLMLAILLGIGYFVIVTVFTKKNVPMTNDFLIYFLLLGLIYIFLFAIMHPGIWNYDTVGMIHLLRVYNLTDLSQGLLTNCFMGAILSVIPNISAIVIVQLIIVVGLQAYVAALIKKYSGKRYIAILILIADIVPLNIIVNMFPLRMAVYGHFCELLIVLLWEECWVKRNEATSLTKLLFIGIISGCIASWRFDTIFAVFFSGIIFLLFKKQNQIKKIVSVVTPIIVYCMISLATNTLIPYPTTIGDIGKAMCTTLSVMSQEELKGQNISKWMEDIDQAIDIDIVKAHPSLWSPEGFDYGAWQEPSNGETVNALISYFKIVINNLPSYIDIKWKQFVIVSSWDFYGYEVIDESVIESGFGPSITGTVTENETALYDMPGDGIRTCFLKWLYNLTGIEVIDNLLLGVIPAVIAIMIVCCVAIVKCKKLKMVFLLSLFPIFHFLILMSGMATPWPMYFGPIILEGVAMGAILFSTIKTEK